MQIKLIFTFLIVSFYLTSGAQQKVNEDSLLYYKLNLWSTDTYPKNLIKPEESVFAFCKILFKKKNEIDTVIVYNTENYEVAEIIVAKVKTVNFKQFKERFTLIIVPFVFFNGENDKENFSQTSISNRWLYSQLFDTHLQNKKKYSCKLLPPIYTIGYYHSFKVR